MTRARTFIFFCCILVAGAVFLAGCSHHEDRVLPATTPAVSPVTGEERTGASGNLSCTTVAADTPKERPDYALNFIATELLTRPTGNSVTVSLVPKKDEFISFEYGTSPGSYSCRTPEFHAKAGSPQNVTIQGLAPDEQYFYRTCYRETATSALNSGPEHSFHTWRAPGSSFVFDVQADSHLDERASEPLYIRTLENELSDKPDFLIDLGDTFMTEKLPGKEPGAILQQYLRQRSDLSVNGHSVPLYLVLGNHDGEAGYSTDNGRNTLAPLSLQFRKQYFPNPEPDGFYTGNSVHDSITGTKQDYYAWEWGDALFVVLDPYWYTTTKPGGTTDGWAWTLGETQYRWLEQTLEQSHAKYKFVFAHQLVGGDSQGRGGTEFATMYEWGGRNADGSGGFDQHRPGWGVPIHQLLVDNHVTAFFHGHDHFFDMQELDGVIYQEVPQPATITPSGAIPGAEYGYTSGVRLGSPGHLRITVSGESAHVDYIWSGLPEESKSGLENGAVAYSYTVYPGNTS